MGTRCNIHFCDRRGEIAANVYRHWDGYPEGVLPDLAQFFADVKAQTNGDTRFDDPEYLAAKFVVWQAAKDQSEGAGPLNFLGVGVCLRDHGDIEYVYDVICSGGELPEVRHRST